MCMTMRFLVVVISMASVLGEVSNAGGNPIRKVVSMLQNMQKGVEAEGKKEQILFDKFMCYCSNGAGSIDTAISIGSSSVEALSSKIDRETALRSQLEQEVTQHSADGAEAKRTVEESKNMREREAADFASASGEMKANVQAMDNALAALKKGLGYAMLQTNTASFLRSLIAHSPVVRDIERDTLLSFLDSSSSSQEAGSSDQIIGIVDQMKETMQGDLAERQTQEEQAKSSFKILTDSKAAEISAAKAAVEAKTVRSGELSVSVSQAKASLVDTQEALAEDKKFRATLASSCSTKQQEWDSRSKSRSEEIAAISETIEILNDDSALDLFKKTMPSPGGALLQVSITSQAKGHALSLLSNLIARDQKHVVQLRMIMLALKSRNNGGFDKVTSMIDGMVDILKKEQADAEAKKTYCVEELHKAEVEEKQLKGHVHNVETEITQNEDELAQLKDEIAQAKGGIAELDKMVTEATQQRKAEHEEYTDTASSNSAALQLLEMAKNRMHKFYNPSLYTAPVTTTVADSPYGFVQITQHHMKRADPGPAPITFISEYQKSSGSTGIIAMMDQMIKDVENDNTSAKHAEADAQKYYTEAMTEATTKRADDSKLVVQKESEKATLGETLATQRELRYTKRQQFGIASDKLSEYHQSCDYFMENFDEAKENRAKETDDLKQAKSVLKGASVGLVQK